MEIIKLKDALRHENDKYAGGNTFVDSVTGERYNLKPGIYSSPSGKISELREDGAIITDHSSHVDQIGNVYKPNEKGEYELVGNDGRVSNPKWGDV